MGPCLLLAVNVLTGNQEDIASVLDFHQGNLLYG